MKFLTQYSNKEDFFKGLEEDEIFMYSFNDYVKEDIAKFAEQYKIIIEYIKKGTEDYKKYGECAVKVINIHKRKFNFELDSNKSIEVEAESEESAKLRLLDILFSKGYVKLEEISS